jgi:ATP-binding cassette, subfamily B, bacterial
MKNDVAAYLARLADGKHDGLPDPVIVSAEPSASFARQLQLVGVVRHSLALIGAHALATVFLLLSWYFLGSAALAGRADAGWLTAWAIALACTVPLRAVSRWLEGVVATGFGGVLRQRMLVGAMALQHDVARASGTGRLLSEVLESDVIDSLGATGAVQAGLALVELAIAAALMIWAVNSPAQVGVLMAVLAWAIYLMRGNLQARMKWTERRLTLTAKLVENMGAHRTRLAQQAPDDWHRAEDRDLSRYLTASCAMDSLAARLIAIPRAYVLVAVAMLAPAFAGGQGTSTSIALTLGAILFAATSIEHLVMGYSRGAGAWVAWRVAAPIFDAGAPSQVQPIAATVLDNRANCSDTPVLVARELSYRHQQRHETVLHGCSLTVMGGDKILLQGNSGSGKSTLAALLAGQRMPSSGFILAGGLDHYTLGGAGWRNRVASAPQYHENHILSATLVFNLLLARPFPHVPTDVDDAFKLCEELGLGPLIARMPAGLNQMVGETGWRLSQGEASRVFLARALLQSADVVVLDESFAALDPDTLAQCLDCAMRRIPTLILIAHP